MILIYSGTITPRLEYISRLLFRDILHTRVVLTNDLQEFSRSPLPKINYSESCTGEGLFLKAGPLLFRNLRNHRGPVADEEVPEGFPFPSSDDSFLPFDPLASAFYLVSRYEEYLPGARDLHGRFPSSRSILSRLGLLETPVINQWARELAGALSAKYPTLTFPSPSFDFLITIDVDNAWAVKHKGLFRSAGSLLKAAITGDTPSPRQRLRILAGKEQDPYDTYGYLQQLLRGHEEKTRFFFLMESGSRYDRQVPPGNRAFRELVRELASLYRTGIHPSYRSAGENGSHRVRKETERLRSVTGREVTSSRQHFLRMELPRTYRLLEETGIREDYSMGYPDAAGFRAGIATPFRFYDLPSERETELLIIPFQIMDGMLRSHLRLSPDEAILKIRQLAGSIRQTGGLFAVIWHNESLSEQGPWRGWRQVFEQTIETGFRHGNIR